VGAKAKGSLFVYVRKWVEEQEGPAGWQALTEGLADGDRAVLDGLLALGQWYPVGHFNRLARRFIARHDAEGVVTLARYIAANDLSVFFKMVMAMASPEFLLRRTGSIYQRYFDSGELVAQPEAPRRWSITLDGPRDEEGGPNEVICRHGVRGWIIEALERTGAKQHRVAHVLCRHRGSPRCLYHVSW
jgi:hypothetical protein